MAEEIERKLEDDFICKGEPKFICYVENSDLRDKVISM